MSIYLDLTRQFNAGAVRAILSSGQAVVLHRLAIMSKDGDWILREHAEDLRHVLAVLEQRRARYRFGAPLGAAHEIVCLRAERLLPQQAARAGDSAASAER
jgi:hypothetical protein